MRQQPQEKKTIHPAFEPTGLPASLPACPVCGGAVLLSALDRAPPSQQTCTVVSAVALVLVFLFLSLLLPPLLLLLLLSLLLLVPWFAHWQISDRDTLQSSSNAHTHTPEEPDSPPCFF
ncbi:hypothetical protein GGTG_08783 [Gaeumannomyces tritici R3-111a-1]|uniref:Uncharacterized protein n=1 Tax=Gaeumannomyces tritici (strain R3-111a-1) TaxID=644352 RepID=J3P5J4_GAET3|nr:hypothetical protein GGTG_08783 [Gaeumannomyces tritici R3-111a-1]EJT74945.1 hypothetical protein GGTG_08783 [Gaeumannomyces tritici R3-111a-1]